MALQLVEMEAISTDSTGAQTLYSRRPIAGYIETIRYIYTDLASGATFTFTTETIGLAILTVTGVPTQDTSWFPRSQIVNASGAPVVGGYDKVPLNGDRVKLVIAAGGASKTGRVVVIYREADRNR